MSKGLPKYTVAKNDLTCEELYLHFKDSVNILAVYTAFTP